jgi:hypothetical protein
MTLHNLYLGSNPTLSEELLRKKAKRILSGQYIA